MTTHCYEGNVSGSAYYRRPQLKIIRKPDKCESPVDSQLICWDMKKNNLHFAYVIFKCIWWIKIVVILFKIPLNIALRAPIVNTSAMVQEMAWRRTGHNQLAECIGVGTNQYIVRTVWGKWLMNQCVCQHFDGWKNWPPIANNILNAFSRKLFYVFWFIFHKSLPLDSAKNQQLFQVGAKQRYAITWTNDGRFPWRICASSSFSAYYVGELGHHKTIHIK